LKNIYAEEFVLETDHQQLKYLQQANTGNSRLMRWALLTAVTIRYLPISIYIVNNLPTHDKNNSKNIYTRLR
jgi:hypothetical protein